MILQSVYNGPIQYFARLSGEEETVIERYDTYTKQTYRNRCRILGANGPVNLTIPVINISGEKSMMKDIRIDYSMPWQKIHWRGINSAYASSPFFEFIMDDFIISYEKKYTFLIDFNHVLLATTLSILDIDCRIKYSERFTPIESKDPRTIIHPKRDFSKYDKEFMSIPYNQVFMDKHGFIPNLSVIDLLFNEGLNAKNILQRSTIKNR